MPDTTFTFPGRTSLYQRAPQTRAVSAIPANHCACRGFPVDDDARELSALEQSTVLTKSSD